MLTNASPKSFRCDQCEYTSKRMFDLRRHQQRHTKVKPIEGTAFKCPECSFVTKWKRNMSRHMRKHNKIPTDAELDDETFEEYIVVIETSETESIGPDQTVHVEEIIVPDVAAVAEVSSSPKPWNAKKNKNIIRIECIEESNVECASVKNNNLTDFKFINQQVDDSNVVLETTVTEVEPCPELLDVNLDEPQNVCTQTTITEVFPCPELLDVKIERGFDIVSDICQQKTFTDVLPCLDDLNADNSMGIFKCRDCSYKTKRAYDLRRHKQTHAKPKILNGKGLKCSHCSFITRWKGNMRRHLQKHLKINNGEFLSDDERIFDEEIIVKPLDDKEIYIEPDINVKLEPQTENFETISPSQCLESKETQFSYEKRFKCRQCEYVSKRAFDLRRHEQRHTRTKNIHGIAFQCNYCSFVTKWKRNMRRHMQKHEKRSIVAAEDSHLSAEFENFVIDALSMEDNVAEVKHNVDFYKLEIEVLTPD